MESSADPAGRVRSGSDPGTRDELPPSCEPLQPDSPGSMAIIAAAAELPRNFLRVIGNRDIGFPAPCRGQIVRQFNIAETGCRIVSEPPAVMNHLHTESWP